MGKSQLSGIGTFRTDSKKSEASEKETVFLQIIVVSLKFYKLDLPGREKSAASRKEILFLHMIAYFMLSS